MSSNSNTDTPVKVHSGEDTRERAWWASQQSKWIGWYFELALGPIEMAQEIVDLVSEEGRRWREAEARVSKSHLELVRQATDQVAEFMWVMVGKQPEMLHDSRVAAEKYVASVMALATKLSAGPENLMIVFSLMDSFTPGAYYYQVENLAQAMSRRAGQAATIHPVSFWASAEKHVLTMLAGVASAVQTLQDADNYLTRISNVSNEEYLHFIEEDAYYRWQRAGKPFGLALEYWLSSERAILARIQEQIASSPLGLLAPGSRVREHPD